MHPAVELLIKRMESNPSEFIKGHERHHKWERIIEKYMDYLNSEDREMLKNKYSEIQMEQMHKDVMAELLYGEDPRQDDRDSFEDPFEITKTRIERMKSMLPYQTRKALGL